MKFGHKVGCGHKLNPIICYVCILLYTLHTIGHSVGITVIQILLMPLPTLNANEGGKKILKSGQIVGMCVPCLNHLTPWDNRTG